MSTPSQIDDLELLYAMQIRCGDRKLLLPRNVIMELKPFAEPEPLQHPQTRKLIRSQPWVLGSVIHRNLPVPIISLEMLVDGAADFERRRARLCLMHGISDSLSPPNYAVVCQGFPSLLEVPAMLANNLAEQPAPQDPDQENPFIAGQIHLGGYLSAVPNLPAIESELALALTEAKQD